ncbi:MAG TPA: tRNA pseudouridine(55) synthase TruB [Ignavibacteriaceae bacterium]
MITKKTLDNDFDFQAGEVILIDKPKGWSSFKAVRKIRSAAGVKKVGHAGTLDPMATGLLIICTGKKTKEISSFQDMPKVYEGVITLGKSSKSMDTETEVIEEKPVTNITEEMILTEKTRFTGRIKQIPPMYSALKVNGQTLYKLARKGRDVERQPREVEIYEFDILKIVLPEIHFRIKCSRGTYIRSIADDLGKKLGCGGILSQLRRTAIGDFKVEEAFLPDDFIGKIKFSGENA